MIRDDVKNVFANIVIAVGSVDGMAGAAAYMRHMNKKHIQVIFTQAFEVNKIDSSKWPKESLVGIIDLGVNNKNETSGQEHFDPQQLTIDFVKKIYTLGHKIHFIADEHNKEAWDRVLKECNIVKKNLAIKPKNRTKYPSSCAILKKAFGLSADNHTLALLEGGDQADQLNLKTKYGAIFNKATKSNMGDHERRPYLVNHLAFNEIADWKIANWVNEYDKNILPNNIQILKSGIVIGNGICEYDCSTLWHDATAIFCEAYKKHFVIILKIKSGISIGTNRKDINLLEILKNSGITASGISEKANIAVKDKDIAITALLKFIQNHLTII